MLSDVLQTIFPIAQLDKDNSVRVGYLVKS